MVNWHKTIWYQTTGSKLHMSVTPFHVSTDRHKTPFMAQLM